ncbi:SDR family NAD(P)-dependent oxidoreductase [Nocardia niigatensis]|uniref:SDR family NAD(P)-dependent oxidoreductase n=1 Tax=Nocardia niigatensis TaxID=209249 RepID=UPI000A038D03|nr:SDR family NAD(P)-dependent oxidoreductase [Nocardia niigatensis]
MGQVAVITGAAGGIGRAMMQQFAAAGYAVTGLDLPGACPADDPRSVGCDITDEGQVRAAFDHVMSEHGRIDVLVNNAGISAIGSLMDHDAATYRRVMEVNYIGALLCTRAALAALTATSGRIVVMSSVAGFAPVLGRPAYVGAKHAVTGLFTALRQELAPQGISVTMVHPTFVLGGMSEVGRAAGVQRATTGPEITSEDVARLVVRAVLDRKDLVLPGLTAKLAWWADRISPSVYARLMTRKLRRDSTPAPALRSH